jgi:hypothetical protein
MVNKNQLQLFPAKPNRVGKVNSTVNAYGLPDEYVYLVENDNGHIKIGRSQTPPTRIKTIESNGNVKVTNTFFYGPVGDAAWVEGYMHKLFSVHRMVGEWFDIPFETAKNALSKKRWECPEYSHRVEDKIRKAQKGIDIEPFLKQIFPGLAHIDAKPAAKHHCDLCMCPKDEWVPYANYPFNRSCELSYHIASFIDDENGQPFTLDSLIDHCSNSIVAEFSDLRSVRDIVNEHIQIQVDLGELEEVSPGAFALSVGQTAAAGATKPKGV